MAKPITIRILGDASNLEKALGKAEAGLSKFGRGALGTLAKIGGAIAGAFAAQKVIDFGREAIDLASDLSESMSKVEVVFGKSADAVLDWSKTSATAFGLSQQKALEAAGTYGNLFQAFGIGQDKAQEMSTSLVQLASDLASFNNTSVEDALAALQSGLSGETEPLKRYGIVLSDVRLKQEALALGLIKSEKEALDPATKAQAAFSLAMKDSALAQGDFQRTSDGLANKTKILKAQFENVKAEIGTALLPVMQKLVAWTSDSLIPSIEKTWAAIQRSWPQIRDTILDVWAKVQPVFSAIGEAVSRVAAIFQSDGEGKVAASASKIGDVLRDLGQTFSSIFGAIQAVIQTWAKVVTAIWERWGDDAMRIASRMASAVMDIVSGLLNVLTGIFDLIKAILTGKWGEAWEAVKKIGSGAVDAVMGSVRLLWAGIEGFVTFVRSAISAAFEWAWNAARTATEDAVGGILSAATAIGSAIINGIKRGLNAAVDFAGDIASRIKGAVIDAINSVIDMLNRGIPDSIGWGPAKIDLPDNPIPRIPRAMGGPASGQVLVGERGPEVVNLPRGSSVIPNHALTTGATVNVYMSGRADPYLVGAEVAWALKTSGR